MPATDTAYVEDTISAQFVQVVLNTGSGNTQPLGGMQRFEARFTNPMEIAGATDGKSRFRRTGPYRVDWSASRFQLRSPDSIVDQAGMGQGGNTTVKGASDIYGNYNWANVVFDIYENFMEMGPQVLGGLVGITKGQGGWVLHYCVLTEWRVTFNDGYQFLLEDVQGLALGMYQNTAVGS